MNKGEVAVAPLAMETYEAEACNTTSRFLASKVAGIMANEVHDPVQLVWQTWYHPRPF